MQRGNSPAIQPCGAISNLSSSELAGFIKRGCRASAHGFPHQTSDKVDDNRRRGLRVRIRDLNSLKKACTLPSPTTQFLVKDGIFAAECAKGMLICEFSFRSAERLHRR